MTTRDPHDPAGEFSHPSHQSLKTDAAGEYESHYCTREDCFCAQEGWSQVETQDDVFTNADITTLGSDTCAGETVTDIAIKLILEREKMGTRTYGKPLFADSKSFLAWADDAIEECADQLQYLIAMREALASYLDMP